MRYILDDKHIEFFREHGQIDFDPLFSPEQLEELTVEIASVLRQREAAGAERYAAGRDLWRHSEKVRRLLHGTKLSSIAGQLSGESHLLYGADQLLEEKSRQWDVASLGDLVSIQGLAAGLLLRLTAGGEEAMAGEKGAIRFLAPDAQIDLPELLQKGQRYLLLAYTENQAVYIRNPEDPLGNYLRVLGYNYGDRLRPSDHPLVWRPS